MPFRFQKASCVVVGTFNMYILQPPWLAKRGIIEKDTEVFIESNLSRPGLRFRFPKQDFVWAVAPDKVAVESNRSDIDCGKPIASVLDALPETPVFAVGNNITYEAGRGELNDLAQYLRDFPRPERTVEGHGIAQQTFLFSVKRDDHDFVNLQLSLTEEKLELSCNAHRKLDDHPGGAREAAAAARQFFEDRRQSEGLAQQLFGVTISYDTDNVAAGNVENG
jgi:hypothetical protein